jgi:enterochelin esterase-like enzyme
MQPVNTSGILVENRSLLSVFLGREVKIDFYLPKNVADPAEMSLLLLNDGQNMKEMGFAAILENLYSKKAISPLLCVAVHTGSQRKMEYGVASQKDYLGRGANAGFLYFFYIAGIITLYQGYSCFHFF